MVSAKEALFCQLEVQALLYFIFTYKIILQHILHSQCSHIKHPFWLFSQLDDTLAVSLSGCEMQVSHLGDGVTDGIIKSTFSNLSSMQVGNRYLIDQSRGCNCQHFITVTQYQQQVRLQGIKSICKTAHSPADGLGGSIGIVWCLIICHIYLVVNGKAIALYLLIGFTLKLGQM